MNADSSTALTQLGQLELNDRNYRMAANYVARAQKLRPDDANLALNYGEALSKAGDQRGAEEAIQASLKLNPKQYAARFLLGSIYSDTHKLNAAQDQLEAALLIQATSEAHLKLAEVLQAEQKFEEARQEAEAAIKIRGDSAEAYELLARAYTGLGKNESAQKAQSHAKALYAQKKKPE